MKFVRHILQTSLLKYDYNNDEENNTLFIPTAELFMLKAVKQI